ncbi:MAG: SDR family NAD(P)-dependent oxidoreductase [Alphaproteobacteria bacterium]
MDIGLRGRTALVTGASRGIGKALARLLALEGVTVAAAARRVDDVRAWSAQVAAEGGTPMIPLAVDLYEAGAPERLAAEAEAALGRIDILMNVAGGSRTVPVEAGADQWHEAMLLNFFRLRELTHAAMPGMRRRGWGRIVNFTGTSEPLSLNATSSAKAAVHVWAKGLSKEIGPDGVTINCIQPGRIRSEQLTRMFPTPESERAFAEKYLPVRRFGEADEIAWLAVFLASPRAAYITGAVIPVDGGLRLFAH